MSRIIFIFLVLTSTQLCAQLISVPTGEVEVFKSLGIKYSNCTLEIEQFEISNQVTVKEYLQFLKAIKSTVPDSVYLGLVPKASNLPPSLYSEFLNSSIFLDVPVVGVDWLQAMAYCKWKTFQEYELDTSSYGLYRLPKLSEWLYAKGFTAANDSIIPFEDGPSEWTYNAKAFRLDTIAELFDYSYPAEIIDPPSLKRKIVIGNSWYSTEETLYEHTHKDRFQNVGYGDIGFRILKRMQSDSSIYKKATEIGYPLYPTEYWIKKEWGLPLKTEN